VGLDLEIHAPGPVERRTTAAIKNTPLIHCTFNGVKGQAELEENLQAVPTSSPETIWDKLAELNLTAWTKQE